MHMELLVTKNEAVVQMMRDRFLIDLISDKGNKLNRWNGQIAGLSLERYMSFPAIALVECAGCSADAHEKRQHAERLRAALEPELRDEMAVFLDGEGRVCLLFPWAVRELLETVQQRFGGRFPFATNIGVGIPRSRFADLHHSYRQAEQSLRHKFYKGSGQVIHFAEIKPYLPTAEYPYAIEEELGYCVKSADHAEEIECKVDLFYERLLCRGPIRIDEVYEMTIRLLIGLEKKGLADADKESAYKKYEIMPIVHMETLNEIKSYLKSYLTELWKSLLQKNGHRSIIEKTIQYMEQECQHASLNSVSQKVYMTPTYLSLLFKMSTGKTFIEQLTDIRIDKAKHLLKHSMLKNYEIAEKVGYHDSRYFSQIFKKKVGLSPSVYRESAGK
ncbi:helix-turn-helix domain-containing protein [Paenibacillus piri]|uniref:AraC family transcriptional regulator n=1 Tax=Paenibacillus piri TaxID=2547395 RepID=A0A4R5KDD6_9BACL|nr:helix-turn-helix domain-containing protein [Paenibacillus piri]TDF92528.1 AraC family transcriptional regulator [Paenibacillus piri]